MFYLTFNFLNKGNLIFLSMQMTSVLEKDCLFKMTLRNY